jgi:UDP-3-O-[3-hydroxymyristoyl] glucosamine N-acyltransferase
MKFAYRTNSGILEGEVIGNPNAEVHELSKIEEGKEGSLTFYPILNTITFIL